MSNVILIVVAHADDEVLGCGGTIARHVAEGDVVHLAILADGVSSRPGTASDELKRRMAASENARQILGITSSRFFGLPDNRLDNLPLIDIVQPLEALIKRLRPHTVYTHHHGDLNVDHRITHRTVVTACRPLPGSSVKKILTFEILSSTEWNSPDGARFTPNWYVQIDEYIETKLNALNAYQEEMRNEPHSRSIEHIRTLAKHRGYTVGINTAEAFECIRFIVT